MAVGAVVAVDAAVGASVVRYVITVAKYSDCICNNGIYNNNNCSNNSCSDLDLGVLERHLGWWQLKEQ